MDALVARTAMSAVNRQMNTLIREFEPVQLPESGSEHIKDLQPLTNYDIIQPLQHIMAFSKACLRAHSISPLAKLKLLKRSINSTQQGTLQEIYNRKAMKQWMESPSGKRASNEHLYPALRSMSNQIRVIDDYLKKLESQGIELNYQQFREGNDMVDSVTMQHQISSDQDNEQKNCDVLIVRKKTLDPATQKIKQYARVEIENQSSNTGNVPFSFWTNTSKESSNYNIDVSHQSINCVESEDNDISREVRQIIGKDIFDFHANRNTIQH